VFRDDAVRWPWQVNVLTSPEINAWCMPGGKIAVYTGLLTQLALTDDELAAVLGHEIAHALREHVRERMGRQQATAVGTAVGSAVLEYFTGVNPGELGHTFTQAMFVLPHSREQEQEADRLDVELTARGLRSARSGGAVAEDGGQGREAAAAVALDAPGTRDTHP
jgi:Zn-dependent protease with chaperone function